MTWTLAIDAAWIGLIGALGGVTVTGLVALGTAVLNHRWQDDSRHEDRAERLRESRATLRRNAYARFLAAAEARRSTPHPDAGAEYPRASEPPPMAGDAFEKAQHQFDDAVQQVRLLGGPDVVGALEKFLIWWESFEGPISVSAWDDAERPLIAAMRAEQDADLG